MERVIYRISFLTDLPKNVKRMDYDFETSTDRI